MKKHVISLLALLCIFVCCKKSHDPAPDTPPDPGNREMYQVKLQVSGFEQSIEDLRTAGEDLKTTGDTLSKYIDELYYLVYEAGSGSYRKMINQSALYGGPFGLIIDSLPAGNYVIALVGSRGIINLYGNPYDMDSGFRVLKATLPGSDLFYKRMELTVNGSVNQIVNLDRVVAKLKLVIRDRIPYNAKRLEIQPRVIDPDNPPDTREMQSGLDLFKGELIPYAVTSSLNEEFHYEPYAYDFTSAEKGMENFTLETYLLVLRSATIDLSIHATDDQSNTLGAKTAKGVRLFTGKGTTLSGKLFDGLSTSDSGVNVIINNPEWVEDSIKAYF